MEHYSGKCFFFNRILHLANVSLCPISTPHDTTASLVYVESPGSPGRNETRAPDLGARDGLANPASLKRKLTLLALIDELSALKDDDSRLGCKYLLSKIVSKIWESILVGYEEKRAEDAFVQGEVYEDLLRVQMRIGDSSGM